MGTSWGPAWWDFPHSTAAPVYLRIPEGGTPWKKTREWQKRKCREERHRALCLLKHVFPDLSENEGELLKMLKPLMGWNSTPTNVEILSAISELDVDNQDAFKHVQKEALNQFEEAVFWQRQGMWNWRGNKCFQIQGKNRFESFTTQGEGGQSWSCQSANASST